MNDSQPTGSQRLEQRRIGRYRVERILGRGGFGLVYLALDEQLHRLVAVKVPHPERVCTGRDTDLWLAEARTVAGLDHPHIVPVYDVGSTADCPFFIVSKYIEGRTLTQYIRDDRPSIGGAAELVATIAAALDYAHRNGVVHRDVKPGNVLLDGGGKPFVVDFGLALREENFGSGSGYAGTPAYMSPEQARGEGHRVDGRSDIFSLGVVFYELLTRTKPFWADSQDELLGRIANLEPRPLREFDDSIPRELERIVLRAMSKRASDRYANASEMAEDLRHFLDAPPRYDPTKNRSSGTFLASGNLSRETESSDRRAKVSRSTFFFADFKGFTERVRILEEAAGHQAAAEMKRQVAHYVEEAFRRLEGALAPTDYELIDTAGDGFFFHFRSAEKAFRYAEVLQKLASTHNERVIDEIAEHWFRTGAATGDAAWDAGKPVGHIVNVGSRLQSASTGGDFVVDRATYDDLPVEFQKQFGPKEIVRDKHDKTYEVYRTAFGRALSPLPDSAPSRTATPVFRPTSAPDSKPIRIVPKGLRSFDLHDADFFLELLPGPRDRDGLPDSIRFWKTRIEETDADSTFSVGLIYGPSGCGKSSLVKAGLLPRLSEATIAIYVEATAEDTEIRLLNGLRKRCANLPDRLSLPETLAEIRRGFGIPVGRKVLVVLDQFEQWLHAKKEAPDTELVRALRQCDGSRVQCIAMVRDDFWMAATRFMRELEVRLVEAQNSAAVDLFPIRHAEKVLAAFGRALGSLPAAGNLPDREQNQFIERAVRGLSQEGKVICVRLALFAEMMKGRIWTLEALREVGCTEGVGVTFLEETFSAASAPPEHRHHQKAARAVLKALLPESGSEIKGHMRARQDLLEASGYASRPKDFDDLMRILDGELRLITPTDPEGRETAEESSTHIRLGGRFHQLTHDYLVPSLRDWLTRKQKETRRGRAELSLADSGAVWTARTENKQLPSLGQWIAIRALTAKSKWSSQQRKMMRRARTFHAVRTAVAGSVLAAVTLAVMSIRERGLEQRRIAHAAGLVRAILDADTPKISATIAEMAEYRTLVDPMLRQECDRAAVDSRQKLNTSLALLPVDPTRVEYLYGRLLESGPHDASAIGEALAPHSDGIVRELWSVVRSPDRGKESQRLRAASALARYDPDSENWEAVQRAVGHDLVGVPSVHLAIWMDALRPVRIRLLAPLAEVYADPERRDIERSLATDILADYAVGRSDVLAELVMDADVQQFAIVYPKFVECGAGGSDRLVAELAKVAPPEADGRTREKLARRQANAAVALLNVDRPERVWELLRHTPDPGVRSHSIHRFRALGSDPRRLVRRLEIEPDTTVRRALILSLGEFDETEFPSAERELFLPKLEELYRTAADPGLHAAAEWLLRQWKRESWIREIDGSLARDAAYRIDRLRTIRESLSRTREKTPPQWYVNSRGQTMVVMPGPVELMMGSPASEIGRYEDEQQYRKRIDRSFAIASKPVTLEQFRQFAKDHQVPQVYSRMPDLPAVRINWFMAAAYCNWLSELEGVPANQWCYEIDHKETKLAADYLSRSGYRLPTEAELEYATRAGAKTSRFFGESEELIPKYAWFQKNSKEQTWPVGIVKPNDLGFFDVHGNVFNWCVSIYRRYPADLGAGGISDACRDWCILGSSARPIGGGRGSSDDCEDDPIVGATIPRVLRGGTFNHRASILRSALRGFYAPTFSANNYGFRPTRTLLPSQSTAFEHPPKEALESRSAVR